MSKAEKLRVKDQILRMKLKTKERFISLKSNRCLENRIKAIWLIDFSKEIIKLMSPMF